MVQCLKVFMLYNMKLLMLIIPKFVIIPQHFCKQYHLYYATPCVYTVGHHTDIRLYFIAIFLFIFITRNINRSILNILKYKFVILIVNKFLLTFSI